MDHKSLQTLFAEHVEALQQFRFSVGVETDTTSELVFQLPESLLTGGVPPLRLKDARKKTQTKC